jgi:hypothetical protein
MVVERSLLHDSLNLFTAIAITNNIHINHWNALTPLPRYSDGAKSDKLDRAWPHPSAGSKAESGIRGEVCSILVGWSASTGTPLRVVSERLGRADPNIPLAVYSHSLPTDHKAASRVTKRSGKRHRGGSLPEACASPCSSAVTVDSNKTGPLASAGL